ncbi:MAG TPA: aminoglycoside phosphotransferase family protein [Roseiflexaceae bacterium]|nr:aminoglycoside phosphotransferase family protein [Roseiflexaceae bacterium]
MLEPPDIPHEHIRACLRDAYGVRAPEIAFLPLGADVNTAVYRTVADDGNPYFVKLRSGPFDELSVALPRWLSDQGIAHIIPPVVTRDGRLWTCVGAFTVILYPFVAGQDGFAVALSERQWHEFGTALRRIHTAAVPPALAGRLARETYTPHWREAVKLYLARLEHDRFDDPIAAELAAFLQTQRTVILDLIGRAERLAGELQAHPRPLVVCHSDIHAGNLLIDGGERLFIVDWDTPILAPKERDLMYIGGAQGFVGRTADEEERLFYQGYGQVEIDPAALAYYRYERIIQDIAAYCEQLLLTTEGGADREQSLRYVMSNFLPDSTIAMAYRTERC